MTPESTTLDKGKRDTCKGCGATIWWRPWPTTGKMHPFNENGTSHFGTCPNASQFRKPRVKA